MIGCRCMRLETKAGEKKRAFCRPASSRYNRAGCQPSLSLSVLETRAACILVTGRLRQAIGFGLITIEDFSLTGQIPMLFRPWVHRRVVRFVSHLYLLSEYCAEHARQRSPRRY